MSEIFLNRLEGPDPRYEHIAPNAPDLHNQWQAHADTIAEAMPLRDMREAVQDWATAAKTASIDQLIESQEATEKAVQRSAWDCSLKSVAVSQDLTVENIMRGNIAYADVSRGIRPNHMNFTMFYDKLRTARGQVHQDDHNEMRNVYNDIVAVSAQQLKHALSSFYAHKQVAIENTQTSESSKAVTRDITGVLARRQSKFIEAELKKLEVKAQFNWTERSGAKGAVYRLGWIATFGAAYKQEQRQEADIRRRTIPGYTDESGKQFGIDVPRAVEKELLERRLILGKDEEQKYVTTLFYRYQDSINTRLTAEINRRAERPQDETPKVLTTHEDFTAEVLRLMNDDTPLSLGKAFGRVAMQYHPDKNSDTDPEQFALFSQWYTAQQASEQK